MDLDMTNRNSRSGGRILVDQLLVHGADMAFCVPGESYLEVLDALYDSPAIRLVNARHEAGAANMAEAYGKLTGRPGIAMVTRGPGACHAAVGVHTAFQDSTPMILIVGQVAREAMDREGFQEIDYRQMFGPVAKWTAQIDRTDRIPEYMSRAYHVATSGRPGPVVLALPEDMLVETADVRDAQPYVQHRAAATAGDIAAVRGILAGASRPLMLIGGSCWSDEACRQAIAFAEANGIPTAVSFRRQDLFSTRSPVYAGDIGTSGPPALIARFKEADVVLVVGARLGEMTTQGYTTLDSPEPRQALIHVHPHADELGRVFRPTLGIVSSGDGFFAAASAMAPLDPTRWAEWTAAARRDYLATLEVPAYAGPFDAARAMRELDALLPADAIVTLDAGNHTGWPQRYLGFGRPRREVGPTSGAMGYSVPAAVAASLVHRDRVVVGFVGDGGFMMSGQEVATAVQYGSAPIIVVFNNRMYGTIRMHQEREHPERVVGTDLSDQDFRALGAALGCHAERVERTEEFAAAFARARASGRAAVIELITDPEIVSTRLTITGLRAKARQASGAR
jgi:acetolactate synthase-1/2/3 large subunit